MSERARPLKRPKSMGSRRSANSPLRKSGRMEFDERRSRLAVILAVEERVATDWLEVERQPLGPDAEAIRHPHDHALARGHLGLAHRGARFHVHDDGVVEIDEVVGRIAGCAVPIVGVVALAGA